MRKIIFLLGVGLMLFYIYLSQQNNILYSWSMAEVNNPKNIIDLSKKLKIKTIYQKFSKDFLLNRKNDYLKTMADNDIEVFHLTGHPSWGKSDSVHELINRIDLVIDYNKNNQYQIKGIVFDIEPYILVDFNDDDLKEYVDNLIIGYQYANRNNLYYVVVIPYWLDNKNRKLLEKLIKNGCDEVSVMNYNIEKTVQNIKKEYYYTRKYNKKINTIYEINFDVDEYFDSYQTINNDFKNIKNNYHQIRKAYHHYGSMKK